MAGIVGYGAYIPRNRIKVEEIAKVWGADAPSYKKGLDARGEVRPVRPIRTRSRCPSRRRSTPSTGRDRPPPDRRRSTSAPNRTLTRSSRAAHGVAEALGAVPEFHCADLEFACKAGTEGMFIALNLVRSGAITYGLGVGADTSQGAPGDALEYSAAAGAAAFIFGKRQHRGRGRPHLLLHDRHPGLLAARVPALPAARRPVHRRARLTSSTSSARPRRSWRRRR